MSPLLCSRPSLRVRALLAPVLAGLLAGGAASGAATARATAVAAPVDAPSTAGAPASPGPAAVAYRRPVPGPVVRPFAPPATPYGPGHRGVDLAAEPGDPVVAAAGGEVVFDGVVAGIRWLTLEHADGVRTTYGPLAGVLPWKGQFVPAGGTLGWVAAGHGPGDGAGLHWSARRGGGYIDPLSLLNGAGTGRWRPALVGPGGWAPTDEPQVPSYDPWDGEHNLLGLVPGSPEADGPGWLVAPNPNHVIGVAGWNSATGTVPLDLTHLGYRKEDITYLSYAGRREQAGDPDDPYRDQLPYGASDTWQRLHDAALLLQDQLRAQWRRSPGQAVDLVGYSEGGVVILYYLLVLHDPADPTLPPVAHAASLASPLEGADVANAVLAAETSIPGHLAVEGLAAWLDQNPHAPVVEDLAVGSPALRALADGWRQAREDRYRSPLATGTRVMTYGGSQDLFIPDHRTDLPGGDHVVLPGNHLEVPETEAARIALRAFLAGEPVPGEDGGLGHLLTRGVSASLQVSAVGLRGLGVLYPRVDQLVPGVGGG